MSHYSAIIFIKMVSPIQIPSMNNTDQSCQIEHCTCGGLPGMAHSFQDSTPAFSSKDNPHLKVKDPEERKNHNEAEEQCEFATLDSNCWALMGPSFILCEKTVGW
jgi:hypothetical protein